jgi:NAD(P)-dependent dehydrogenase (short-subunit alcohol dehydrogenase family)
MSANPRITDWKGKTVWVVGASSGIGEALAVLLAQRGAKVIASARRDDRLRSLAPAPFMILPMDVGQETSIVNAIATLEAANALPDIVFWVAGVYYPMASDAIDLNGVRETFEINTMSGYAGLSHMLKAWARQPASPKHWSWVSSVAGYRGLPQAAAYGASKAALTYLAEVNHVELKDKGIAVSVVCPGFVETRLTKKNTFAMPAILTPQQAAHETLKGLARGSFEIHYPKRFTLWLKFLRLLPYSLYFRLIRNALPKS